MHEYANLYFDAHNPMLSRRRAHNDSICVLRIAPTVMDLPDVVVTDMNAARDWVRFYSVGEGLGVLDKDQLYAAFWINRDDPVAEDRHKALKCAEVLVPDVVNPDFIFGAYVANRTALAALNALNVALPAEINGGMFF